MNNKIYKWLAVTLLLSVSVFCYLYLTKLPSNNKTNQPATANEIPTDVEKDETPPPPEPPVYYNTLPREAVTSGGYKIQNIGGTDNEILREVYTVGDYTYLFFDTYSNGYDIKSEKPSVAAAILDKEYRLLRTVVFNGQSDEKFNSVKLTSEGFILVASGTDYTVIYKLSDNLINLNKFTFESCDDARLYLDGENIYLLLEKINSLQIKVLNNSFAIIKSASVSLLDPEIFDIFPIGNTLNIFVNCTDGYSLLRYTPDGGFSSVNSISDTELIAVLPTSDGFVGLRRKEYLSVFTANNDFSVTNEKIIEEAKDGTVFVSNDNFALYLDYGNYAEVAIYCKHLDLIFKSETSFFEEILYRNYNNNKIIGYCENKLSVASFDGISFSITETFAGRKSFCKILYDGTICFSSTFKNGIYAKNYGNSDVFIIKSLGN